jgi:oligopeptide/dipeptide ABC transporter ATP-binding protein
MEEKVLEVDHLHAAFSIQKKEYEVLHDISLQVHRNETVCIVGESGCGKSVTTLCIMGLLPNNGRITSGRIFVDGSDLTQFPPNEVRKFRGKKMGMIFQEPMTALNPLLTIGYQIRENLMVHRGMNKREANAAAVEYLRRVGIANPEARLKQYPFQLSGGLRQRVLIAMVLSAQPDLLIADEPTTALDVTIQKQVLALLNDLKKDMNAGILFITHDLGVVAEIADRVVVLYAGRKVEEGSTAQIFNNPLHPYTIGLMNAVPRVDVDNFEIQPIPGMFPSLTEEIPGCRFHPRCPHAKTCPLCSQQPPAMREYEPGHFAACHLLAGKEEA